jgi:hypothetical protein
MTGWVSRMIRLFKGEHYCRPVASSENENKISGEVRQAQQLVHSSAQKVIRTSAENAHNARQITEWVRERSQSKDDTYAAANQVLDFIRERDQEQRSQ